MSFQNYTADVWAPTSGENIAGTSSLNNNIDEIAYQNSLAEIRAEMAQHEQVNVAQSSAVEASASPVNDQPSQQKTSQAPVKTTKTSSTVFYHKLIFLIGGLLLSLISVIALGLSQVPEDYYQSSEQFGGDLQLDELEEEVLLWDNEYSDLYSTKSQSVAAKLKEKLGKSLAKQGISVDDITITGFQPSEAKTIKKVTVPKKVENANGRMITRSSSDVFYHDDAMILMNQKPDVTKYTNVSTLDVKYSVKGKPFKNAALFGSAVGKWHEIQSNVENDLARQGAKGHFTNDFEPSLKYMSVVINGIRNHPAQFNVIQAEQERVHSSKKQYSTIDCEFTGVQLYGQNAHTKCESNCPQIRNVFGGKDGVFSYQTSVCAAAYYVGVTNEVGGVFEVISLGVGRALKGEEKRNIIPEEAKAEFPMFKLKKQGKDVVLPDLRSLQRNAAPSECTEALATTYLQVSKVGEKFLKAGDLYHMGEAQYEEQSKLMAKLQEKVVELFQAISMTAVKCSAMTTVQHTTPDEGRGYKIGFCLLGKSETMKKNIDDIGIMSVVDKINSASITGLEFKLLSFRYELKLLQKLKE